MHLHFQEDDEDYSNVIHQEQYYEHVNRDDRAIVCHIASFLSLTDAASLGGGTQEGSDGKTVENVSSWASLLIETPETPGLMALSPDEFTGIGFDDNVGQTDEEASLLQKRIQDRQRRLVTQKLATAVLSHPDSLRSFCSKAHQAATEIQREREARLRQHPPETLREPGQRTFRLKSLLKFLYNTIFENVPISVSLHLLNAIQQTILDTAIAAATLTLDSINSLIDAVVGLLRLIWRSVCQVQLSSASEVLVSGIQSVATSVGSAAFHRFSSRGDNGVGNGGIHTMMMARNALNPMGFISDVDHHAVAASNQRLIEKLSAVNAASRVVAYQERREDEALTRKAKKRVQRMMHYDVSLRPFMATVRLPSSENRTMQDESDDDDESSSSHSPLLYTPKSFPPTPASRSLVMARGSQFSDDVVFLARDKLRIEDGLDSSNERTRAMAHALQQASRLAVFNAADVGSGVVLTCGQHVATKIGTTLMYCSTRSMVPVLRNCYAYFEMVVLPSIVQRAPPPPPCSNNIMLQQSSTSLSIGLSTLEMPLNTLAGAWKGSVGFCTTGQILAGGQWFSPNLTNPNQYGENTTVGCLVCLDDNTAFETWDGVMVMASITFNINGQVVSPPMGTPPSDADAANPRKTLSLLVPMEEELFPTLTLHSPETQVMCRFSSGDITATSRDQIGAPPGVFVYAVDGSTLFEGC
mmetsp:Transcript_18759/g.27731  ORF Transcript_18759/g.27731 Transcript_18759/m.27731 type:complete len:697 (+) Transcript_18759:410-2500(+)|eukprot:CAMPEP_0194228332 /NCGR_PEP_ID=MMETSP0156-20130528/43318_1 /TAXON_ID=33649 /ORGANISM="Thalassionema nitzschioides, Strain L26-B" /LENGTH=696 /DNA_ID=CAMNT_0038960843 /DNA_START=288 /DNA_END=2378 /DNA_ORIENTATION=+